jgi:hypothetical protein
MGCHRYWAPLSAKPPIISHPADLRDRQVNREVRFKFQQERTHDWVMLRDIIKLWDDAAIDYLKADLAADRLGPVIHVEVGFKLAWLKPGAASRVDRYGLERCWMLRDAFEGWCARWGLPIEEAADFAGEIAPVTLPEATTAPATVPEATTTPIELTTGGRPSVWSLYYEPELRRRVATGERHRTVPQWADALGRWFAKAHPAEMPIKSVTLCDNKHIRKVLKELGVLSGRRK